MPSAKNNGLLVRKKIKKNVKKLLTYKMRYVIIIIWVRQEKKSYFMEVKK